MGLVQKLLPPRHRTVYLDKAIEDFIADPRSETEDAVVEQYNELVNRPMNFKLLDTVQNPYVPEKL